MTTEKIKALKWFKSLPSNVRNSLVLSPTFSIEKIIEMYKAYSKWGVSL